MDADVIVVGARVAGSATAMLLARQGLRVLLLEQARLPSDTLSSHQVQVPGVALLRDWGLLDALAGTPPISQLVFDTGTAVLRGSYPEHRGITAMLCPRRTLLDGLLAEAAQQAGARLRDGVIVTGLSRTDKRVTGVLTRTKGGGVEELRAGLVVGADGKHSTVAKAVAAREYRAAPAASGVAYAYFEGLPLTAGEVYSRAGRLVGAWPTNDDRSVVYFAVPRARFGELRRDPVAITVGLGDLTDRLRAATLVEHVRATDDLPSVMRKPYGPGYLLVGDAGLVMDPGTGQGIGNALADAAAASAAIVAGLGGATPLPTALRAYHRARDAARRPMFDLTVRNAKLEPDRAADEILFPAIAADPVATSRFFGVLAGIIAPGEFFSPEAVHRLVGTRGLFQMLLRR